MGRRSPALHSVEQPEARPSQPLLPPPSEEVDEFTALLDGLRQSSPGFRSNVAGLHAAWEASQEDDDREPWPSAVPPPPEVLPPLPEKVMVMGMVPEPPRLVLVDKDPEADPATDLDALVEDEDDAEVSPTRTGRFRRRGARGQGQGQGQGNDREREREADPDGEGALDPNAEALLRRIARR
ncbi:MAG: hypothetical protein HY909_09075 [Deltaproteobacteria bacterium]|nr:hypothetical protein [Deltaproteobacteria bacterium]